MAQSMDMIKSLLGQIVDHAVATAESATVKAAATPADSHAPAVSAAQGLDELPVLKSLAAKRPHLRTVTLHEGPHSHFTFAQPALELVPDKLVCVEWVELKGRNRAKVSALMTDVQLSGPDAVDGHSYLVVDLYVPHFNSGSAMRVELLVFDAATEKCFRQPVNNIASGAAAIISRSTPPQLSAKAALAIESAEKQFEIDCASHVGRHIRLPAAHSPSRSSVPAVAAGDAGAEGPIAARLRQRGAAAGKTDSDDSGDDDMAPEAQHEEQKEPRKAPRKPPTRPRGMTKKAVDSMINSAVKSAESRITSQLKRQHDQLMSAIGGGDHDNPAKRPRVGASAGFRSAPAATATAALSLPQASHPAALVGPAPVVSGRVPLATLQPASLAQLLLEDADMVYAASRTDHELFRDEQQQQQQNKLARIIAAASFEAGVAEGARRAQERVRKRGVV